MPWHTKSILVIPTHALLNSFFPFSIAHRPGTVEGLFQVGLGSDLRRKLTLGPVVLRRCVQIPRPLLRGESRLQDDRVLRPSQPHRQLTLFRSLGVGPVEFPHPAQVPGRETLDRGVVRLKVLSGHHRRALLRAGTDSPADLEVPFHLRQSRRHETVQRLVHGAVVCGFSDVHGSLLSGAVRLIFWRNVKESVPYRCALFHIPLYSACNVSWKQPLSRSATSSSGMRVPSVRTRARSTPSIFFSRPGVVT